MHTVSKPRPPRQAEPVTARLDAHPGGVGPLALPGLVELSRGQDAASYYLWVLPSDWGHAFRLEKFASQGNPEGQQYDVSLEPAGNSCECWGWLRWGHCRHVSGLSDLVARGELGGAD